MAHPKRKTSKTRRDKRRTHVKASMPTFTICKETVKDILDTVHIMLTGIFTIEEKLLVEANDYFTMAISKPTTNNQRSSITACIRDVTGFVPHDILSNKELEKMVDTNDEWIKTRTGIHERRILKGKAKEPQI